MVTDGTQIIDIQWYSVSPRLSDQLWWSSVCLNHVMTMSCTGGSHPPTQCHAVVLCIVLDTILSCRYTVSHQTDWKVNTDYRHWLAGEHLLWETASCWQLLQSRARIIWIWRNIPTNNNNNIVLRPHHHRHHSICSLTIISRAGAAGFITDINGGVST